VSYFEKQRVWAPAGSIADALDMFRSEVRFYREIAARVGVRVPRCFQADETATGTLLRLEDLSGWQLGGDPRPLPESCGDCTIGGRTERRSCGHGCVVPAPLAI
jgi:hypothetical protein